MEKRKAVINGKENEFYYVDTLGNVENVEGHVMTQFKTRNGYMRVKLSRGTKRGMYLVHRIVAETFIDNPDELPIVNHLNSVRHDSGYSWKYA